MPPANSAHTPARLYEGLMEICRACQRKKGRCKLSRVCEEAYEILSGKTGLELEEIFRKLEDHKPDGREAKPEEISEEEPEEWESEYDMYEEDIEEEDE